MDTTFKHLDLIHRPLFNALDVVDDIYDHVIGAGELTIVHHDDGDGRTAAWGMGVLVERILTDQHPDVKYLEMKVPADIETITNLAGKVIVVDLSAPEDFTVPNNVMWFDHHVSTGENKSPNVYHLEEVSTTGYVASMLYLLLPHQYPNKDLIIRGMAAVSEADTSGIQDELVWMMSVAFHSIVRDCLESGVMDLNFDYVFKQSDFKGIGLSYEVVLPKDYLDIINDYAAYFEKVCQNIVNKAFWYMNDDISVALIDLEEQTTSVYRNRAATEYLNCGKVDAVAWIDADREDVISFRSKNDYALFIAKQCGGGGHRCAAGGKASLFDKQSTGIIIA